MRLRKAAIEKLGDVLLRLGEAAIIGAAASLFIQDFLLANSLYGFGVGVTLIAIGVYAYNKTDQKGQ